MMRQLHAVSPDLIGVGVEGKERAGKEVERKRAFV